MQASKLANLIQINPTDRAKLATIDITDVVNDTRKITPGCCFVAITGGHFDGHEHVEEALQAGAALVVVEHPIAVSDLAKLITVPDTYKALAQISTRFYGNPSTKLTTFGVTGTNGKTTITHLISQIMEDFGQTTGIIGTMYNKIGAEKFPTVNTTPDPHTVQSILQQMVAQNVASVAMEVSSIALVQGRVWGVDFDTAIFTNLTEDHLDYHKTFENYLAAKTLLFSQLGNGFANGEPAKNAIINIDDPAGLTLLDKTAANILTYGTQGQGLLQAHSIRVTSHGTEFDLSIDDQTYPVKLRLMGDFNVYNALAAFGATYVNGVPAEDIIASLEEVRGVRGRFEVVPNDRDVTVIVDYAHTPDGLQNVLETINAFKRGRVFCVVGCGGDRDALKRPIMAQVAVDLSTNPVFTSDNPRTEDPDTILDDMVINLNPEQYVRQVDRKAAIHYALDQAVAGDVVLIAGKGHEDYQIIGTTKHHFDDVEIVNHYYNK